MPWVFSAGVDCMVVVELAACGWGFLVYEAHRCGGDDDVAMVLGRGYHGERQP